MLIEASRILWNYSEIVRDKAKIKENWKKKLFVEKSQLNATYTEK